MLVTLGFIALLLAVILIICGYTVAPQALRPGFGCLILAIVLLILGYLLPAVTTPHDDTYDGAAHTYTLGV